jgi:hypothetical protein
MVGVESGLIGTIKTLAHLDVEDFETQTANGIAVLNGLSKANAIFADLSVNARPGWSDGKNRKQG